MFEFAMFLEIYPCFFEFKFLDIANETNLFAIPFYSHKLKIINPFISISNALNKK